MIPPERDVWCIDESCPGRADLKQFLDEQLSDVDSESEFHYNQWDIIDWASLTTITITCEDYKDVLIVAIDKSTKHLYLAMCQAQALVVGDFAENYQFLSLKAKSKVIIGVRSTVHYIQLLCILKMIQVVFGTSPSVLYHLTTCTIHVLSKDSDQLPSWITTTSQNVVLFLWWMWGIV